IGNTVDAIGSVANYFKAHGWKTGEAVALPATVKGNGYKTLTLDKFNPIPTNRLSELRALGININPNVTPLMLDPKTSVALIALEDETGPTYWLGLNNFYVITRYNHSNHYAMAVYQLSEILKTHYRQSGLTKYHKMG
ncbi:MAG TPA: lytic murein transglycosylase, partial [Gammaproteobacteria bacterium]|nr:lytic murein transglycosylase [Gammaproteobacteria bacterium]